MTVLDVLQATTAYFAKRNIENPRLNAEHLLAHALDRKRIELYLEFERVLNESELAPLRELVKRRGEGETFGGVDVEQNTKEELYARARRLGVEGRSKMSKRELARAIARKQ